MSSKKNTITVKLESEVVAHVDKLCRVIEDKLENTLSHQMVVDAVCFKLSVVNEHIQKIETLCDEIFNLVSEKHTST